MLIIGWVIMCSCLFSDYIMGCLLFCMSLLKVILVLVLVCKILVDVVRQFDFLRLVSIGFLLVCCLGLWLSWLIVIMGILSFFVNSFRCCENFDIFICCDLYFLFEVISCRQLIMINFRLVFCCRWCVLVWIFIMVRLGELLINSGVLLILFICCVSWVQLLLFIWFECMLESLILVFVDSSCMIILDLFIFSEKMMLVI